MLQFLFLNTSLRNRFMLPTLRICGRCGVLTSSIQTQIENVTTDSEGSAVLVPYCCIWSRSWLSPVLLLSSWLRPFQVLSSLFSSVQVLSFFHSGSGSVLAVHSSSAPVLTDHLSNKNLSVILSFLSVP